MRRGWSLFLIVASLTGLLLLPIERMVAVLDWAGGDHPTLAAGDQRFAVVATDDRRSGGSQQQSTPAGWARLPLVIIASVAERAQLEPHELPPSQRFRGPAQARAPPLA
jgi:hypothetical protein